MPGAYVFPGGNTDPADCDPKWYEHFATFGFKNDSFTSLVPRVPTTRPQIFKTPQNELSRDISLRITAIRETFEECGILMCRRKDDRTFSVWGQHLSSKKSLLPLSLPLLLPLLNYYAAAAAVVHSNDTAKFMQTQRNFQFPKRTC